MQYSLVFLIALALSGAVNIRASPVRGSNEVSEILREFGDVSFTGEIKGILLSYFIFDPECSAVFMSTYSDEFKGLLTKLESTDTARNYLNYLDESGFESYAFINEFHREIGLAPLQPRRLARDIAMTSGLAGFFKDMMAALPWEDLKALQHNKLEASSAFAHAIERLHSPKFQELTDAVHATKEFQEINKFLSVRGFEIEAAKELIQAMYGLEFPDGK